MGVVVEFREENLSFFVVGDDTTTLVEEESADAVVAGVDFRLVLEEVLVGERGGSAGVL
jgi:hypothetical protein